MLLDRILDLVLYYLELNTLIKHITGLTRVIEKISIKHFFLNMHYTVSLEYYINENNIHFQKYTRSLRLDSIFAIKTSQKVNRTSLFNTNTFKYTFPFDLDLHISFTLQTSNCSTLPFLLSDTCSASLYTFTLPLHLHCLHRFLPHTDIHTKQPGICTFTLP